MREGAFARRALTLVATALSLASLAGLGAMPAGAAGGPELLVQFGPTGSGAGQLTNPRGVATDPANGHVYVAEITNRRISEFTAWGEFVKAWGWNVAPDGAPGDTVSDQFEICTMACQAGTAATAASAGSGELSNALGVAVDGSHAIYVVDQTVRRVQKFNAAGEFVLMFGGDVNKTKVEDPLATQAERNICTAASENVCQAGTTGPAQGQFGAWKIGSFIAAGPTGTIYVGDNDRIQEFNPDGTFKGEIPLAGAGFVESLATDPSGNLYVANEQAKVPGIRKLDASGTVLDTITSAVNGQGEPVAVLPKALATDSSGNLYEVDDQPAASALPEVFKFDPGGEQKASFGENEFTASTGIGTNSIGDVYVSNSTTTNSYVRAYGPLPEQFGPPPSVPPEIVAEYAASVGTTSAVVKAEINPHFFHTTYYVEYGTGACSPGLCAREPAPPGPELATQRERVVPTAGVQLSGLSPGQTYHYRFVAVSEAGTIFGPDRSLRTYSPGSFALPDGRAFEMVSPPEKNNAELGVPGSPSGLVETGFSPKTLQAAITGEAIAYPSFTAFGDANSAPSASTYLSRRGPEGWSTANITPPNEEGVTKNPFRGFSADLSFGAVVQREPQLDPEAVAGSENLYVRGNRTGAVRALTTVAPRGPDTGPASYCVGFAGASADYGHVIFAAKGALTPDAPEASGTSLYEWSAGQLHLVSVLPGGAPAPPFDDAASSGFGAGVGCRRPDETIVHNAISSDGSRIFWTTEGRLLARVGGTATIQLDAAQGGPDPSGGGRFWAASDNGSKVFFTSPNRLTADASAPGSASLGDLYLYDFDAEPGERLSDLTVDPTPGSDPPSVLGVLGANEDGSYVYFVANGVLDGAAVAGKPNLYLWRAGAGVHFIATLSPEDEHIGNATELVRFSGASTIGPGWSSVPAEKSARVTPDGRHLAFVSLANLFSGTDNIGQSSGRPVSQVYLYDAPSDELMCASCNPSGARPLGFSELPVWITPYEQPRYLSDDGSRLFFLSLDALSVNDTNGKQDVYEFEREGAGGCNAADAFFSPSSGGCLYPLSSGADGDESFFLDASAEGRDVFLSTRQRLFNADRDERYDIYDARIGGGFPPPPAPSTPCLGEACRPPQAAPPTTPPSSSSFTGQGNLETAPHPRRRCPHGKRAVRRRGKVRCVKRSGRRPARHRRRAAR